MFSKESCGQKELHWLFLKWALYLSREFHSDFNIQMFVYVNEPYTVLTCGFLNDGVVKHVTNPFVLGDSYYYTFSLFL